MVRARLGIGLNAYRACPDFLRTDAGKIDGGLALHARRLGCVWIECMTRDHTDAVMLPLRCVFVVIVAHALLPLQQGSYILYRSFPKIISARMYSWCGPAKMGLSTMAPIN